MDPTDLPGGAFIVREDGELARVSRQSFATEDEFQAMIARHPELLAGDLLTHEAPREWLLVARDSRGEPALRAPQHLLLTQPFRRR